MNPRWLDEDGDLDEDGELDDEDHEREYDDPYEGILLEELLRPLQSASELADHPTLSIPYKSKGLTQMAAEACEMLRREHARLWKAKRLLQRFRGDADWVPSQTFEADSDYRLLHTGEEFLGKLSVVPSILADQPMLGLDRPLPELVVADDARDQLEPSEPTSQANGVVVSDHEAMEGVEAQDMAEAMTNSVHTGQSNANGNGVHGGIREGALAPITNGDTRSASNATPPIDHAESIPNPAVANITDAEAGSETASQSNGTERHAMTTRARARSPAGPSDRTPSPTPSDSAAMPAMHPWFSAPAAALTDRDLGLPPQEAEETRKLLLLYVQKQEQIVRSLDALHGGLQKADRLRSFVYRSCKAEGHVVSDGKGNMVTEMSDGEDWYDTTDWALQPWELNDGKLEKGKDEVEDVEEERGRRPGRGRRVNRI